MARRWNVAINCPGRDLTGEQFQEEVVISRHRRMEGTLGSPKQQTFTTTK
jgi:hypothetical protein